MATDDEKEMYLLLTGWTVERASWDNWWFPPKDSPINKKYSMTRILDHAFEWQKMVDNFEWKHRNY
jgi:hypothetical protein